jgi:hypothetical protein
MSFKMDRSGVDMEPVQRSDDGTTEKGKLPRFEVRISISALPIFRIPNASIVFDSC